MNFGKWIDKWRKEYGGGGLDAYLAIPNGDGTHRIVPNRRPPGIGDAAWLEKRRDATVAWLRLDHLCLARVVATECDQWKRCDRAICRRGRCCLGPTHPEDDTLPHCCQDEELAEEVDDEIAHRRTRGDMMLDDDEDIDFD